MALNPDYVDLEVVRANLRLDPDDSDDDLFLGILVAAASRAIDHATNRQFGNLSAAAARYYDAPAPATDGRYVRGGISGPWGGRSALEIFDLMSTDDLVVEFDQDDDGTFEEATTEFDLWPWNAAADGKPWTHIVFRRGVSVPTLERSVQVTARWGWADVPAAIAEACLLQVNRWYKRRDSAFGVAGSPDMGNELRLLAKLDPDVAVLIAQLNRPWAAV